MALRRDKSGNVTNDSFVSEAQEAARKSRAELKNEKEARRLANAEARAKRTPEEQLALLDQRLGEGVGAKKERARLLALIGKQKDN